MATSIVVISTPAVRGRPDVRQPRHRKGIAVMTLLSPPAIDYGDRLRAGVLIPSGNSVAEPELRAMLPFGSSLLVTRLPLLRSFLQMRKSMSSYFTVRRFRRLRPIWLRGFGQESSASRE